MAHRPDKEHALDVVVAKNAGLSFGGTIAIMFFKLASSVIITRTLGAQLYGIYVLAVAILSFCEIIALFGLENTVVRFVSQFKALEDATRMRGVVFGVLGLVLLISPAVYLGLFALSPHLSETFFSKPILVPVLKIIAISLPFSCISRLTLAALQGIKLIKYKVYVQQFILPITRIFLFTSTVLLGYGLKGLAYSYLLAEFAGAVCGLYYLFRNMPQLMGFKPIIVEIKKIVSFSIPLFFSSFLNRVMERADILIMGYFLPASMLGIYGIAKRFTPFIILPLYAFNNIFAPIISDLYTKKNMSELKIQFKRVTRWIFITSLPIFTLLIFYSQTILSIFGPDFVVGYQAMIILCIGQIINAASGSVGFMLIMTGRPLVDTLNASFLCLINVVLNFLLIPTFGIVGAAFAGALSNAVVQLLRLVEVWYYLRIHPYRADFYKPIMSALITVLMLKLIHYYSLGEIRIMMLPFLAMFFLLSYTAFLWLMKLSPEDQVILVALKNKLLNLKSS